jgi:hypothetical protein
VVRTATDATTAASQFIIERGLFTGPLAGEEQLAGNIHTAAGVITQTTSPFAGPVLLQNMPTATGAVAVAALQGGTVLVVNTTPFNGTPVPSASSRVTPNIYQDTVAIPLYTGGTSVYQRIF